MRSLSAWNSLGRALRGKVPEEVDRVDEWLLVKMFVGKDKAEFYLHINEKAGKDAIALKDREDGDVVMGGISVLKEIVIDDGKRKD